MRNSLLKILASVFLWPFFPMFYVKGIMGKKSYNHNVIEKKNISRLNRMYGFYGIMVLVFLINIIKSANEEFYPFISFIFIGVISNYFYLKNTVKKFKRNNP